MLRHDKIKIGLAILVALLAYGASHGEGAASKPLKSEGTLARAF